MTDDEVKQMLCGIWQVLTMWPDAEAGRAAATQLIRTYQKSLGVDPDDRAYDAPHRPCKAN